MLPPPAPAPAPPLPPLRPSAPRPPLPPFAVLPENTQFVSSSVPPLLKIAPPLAVPPLPPLPPLPSSCTTPSPPFPPAAVFVEAWQLTRLTVPPSLYIAPPLTLVPAVPFVPLAPLSAPLVSVRFLMVKLTPGFTVKRRTAFPPLMLMVWTVPSRTTLVEITIVLVTVIVPEQRKVAVPPSLSAILKPSSVQSATGEARTAVVPANISVSQEINKDARDRLVKARPRDLSVGMNECCNLPKRDNLTKAKSFARGK